MFAAGLLFALLLIFSFNFLGLYYDWYNLYGWYDTPMHIAGGAWVAAAFIYLMRRYAWVSRIARPTFLNVLTVVFVVGIGWEIYEYAVDIYVFSKYSWFTVPSYIIFDSLHDLANDLIGAALMWLLLRRLLGAEA